MNRWLKWGLLALVIIIIGYSFRWTFYYKFDPTYWENYYYTSQWNVANSQRVIGDEGVYRYIGYRLVNGENPFNVDYWVPPLGKYLYGLSAKYLENPYWTSWGWYLLLIGLVGWISRSWWATLLVTINPLIVGQIGLTMLDLPQGVMLLISIGCLWKGRVGLAGMALGLMMGIKIGYFGPMVAIVGAGYILYKTKSIKKSGLFLLAIPIGYGMAYFCYFMAHPNPIPWIRLHQKVIDFWMNAGGRPNPINMIGYIWLNRFNQVWEGNRIWMANREWSIIFPLSMVGLFLKYKQKSIEKKYLTLILVGWLILAALVDFWPRYLVAVVPIMTILVVDCYKGKKWWLGWLVIMNLISLGMVLWPGPEVEMRTIERAFKTGIYNEVYQLGMREIDTNAEIIDGKIESWNKPMARFEVRYKDGDKGKILMVMEKINNQWRIKSTEEVRGNIKIANVVNPVRSRELWKDKTLKPIEKQYRAVKNNDLRATWLLQDDVLNDQELVGVIKGFDNKQELGLFLEISQNLALKSRVYFDEQRPWYDPGVIFLSAYERKDRIKMIDQMMASFKNTFGYLPTSVGAWWIDSYSLEYLARQYGVKTAIIVADQKTTDSYGVWGQWWGYPYYPDKKNILAPGDSKVLVIQWALRDLEKSFFGQGWQVSNYSLQANDYKSLGQHFRYFENLASSYFDRRNYLGQITVGLETGIESVPYLDELENQLKWIKDNQVQDLTMSQTADKWASVYGKNPEEVKIGNWLMTGKFRENKNLGEKTEYQKGMVFSDYCNKDDKPFLNRIYRKENLTNWWRWPWITVGVICLIVLALVIKTSWLLIVVGVILLALIKQLRYSVVNGEKMGGLLIDNFRFIGVTDSLRFVNEDLPNLVAKSMLKLEIYPIYYIYWLTAMILITLIFRKYARKKSVDTRSNNKTKQDY